MAKTVYSTENITLWFWHSTFTPTYFTHKGRYPDVSGAPLAGLYEWRQECFTTGV